jgi:LacI family transcriptional regulator
MIENGFYKNKRKKSAVTIRDIAKEAGVSIATVSRVINSNYPVSGEVKRAVKNTMAALEYRPDANARSLRSKNSRLIALVIADLSNRFFMEAAKGLELVISASGYNLIIAGSGGNVEKERAIINSLLEMRIAGLVMACIDKKPDRLNICDSMGIPVVLIDRKVEAINVSQILWNDYVGSCQLTKHLIDYGHKDIAIVNVSLQNNNGLKRLEGFKRALKDANQNCPEEYISRSNFTEEDAYEYVINLFRNFKPPTAIFCANNIMLNGTLAAMRSLKIQIHNDISLVVFGNPECNKYLDRKITAAVQDVRSMGEIAGRLICDLLENRARQDTEIILDVEIVYGDSVKKLNSE